MNFLNIIIIGEPYHNKLVTAQSYFSSYDSIRYNLGAGEGEISHLGSKTVKIPLCIQNVSSHFSASGHEHPFESDPKCGSGGRR